MRFLLPLLACFTLCQCVQPASPYAGISSRLDALKAERESDEASYRAGTMSKSEYNARGRARLARLDTLRSDFDAVREQQDYLRSQSYEPSYASNIDYTPSYSSRSRSRGRSTIYEDDYSTSRTLGGSYQSTNRYTGSSTTLSRPLGGGYRTQSSSGYTVDWDQNLGGGYTGRDSRGGSWSTGQNLSGQRTVTGSNGRTYTCEQMLGGGYKWTSD